MEENCYTFLVEIDKIKSIELREDAYLLRFTDNTYIFVSETIDVELGDYGYTCDTLNYILENQHLSAIRLNRIERVYLGDEEDA